MIGLPAVTALLNKSLAEEQIADNLMTHFAREFMSESRTGMTRANKPSCGCAQSARGATGADRFDGAAMHLHETLDQGEPEAQPVAYTLQRRIDLAGCRRLEPAGPGRRGGIEDAAAS